jgi:hypothetical protein
MAKQRSAEELEKQLAALNKTIADNQAKGLAKTEAQAAAQERIEKSLARQKVLQAESLETTKEIDDTLQSIASTHGKTSKIYKKTQAQLGIIQGSVESIEGWSSKWVGAANKNKDAIIGAAKGYRNVNAQVLKNIALVGEGKEAQENIADLLDDQIAKHKTVLASITSNTAQSKKLRAELEGEVEAMEKLGKSTKRAEKDIEAMTRMGEKFGGTMFGGAIDKTLKAFGKKDGLGGVVKSLTTARGTANGAGGVGGMFTQMLGGVAKFLGPIGLAVGGIMAAAEFFDSGGAAKMAAKMAIMNGQDPGKAMDSSFKASRQYRELMVDQQYKLPLKLKQQAEKDYLEYAISVAEDEAKYKESLVKDELDYRLGLESDAIQFRQQQASAELDANLSRQKTLFTSAMGYMKGAIGVSERALQAIGSSTAAVLDTVKEYGYTLGIALKDQIALSAGAQGLGVRYGTSATEVFKMADTFRLMNKSSAKVGANLVAGLEVLAKDNDMSPAQLYKEMADAQADILKYSNYTTQEYARQAILLGNMNTSMASMMKASDSMVLNYKDSIKAEMSLSAMLGKNVNFSEVRAKLMSGDQAGGAAALKTALGGQDINAMNPFAKQALSQATGMGIQELMQLTQSKGGDVKGTLEERNARKTGAAIAKGALQQDIANAAAKLALDQKNRAEMLKFEQAKRMGMLFIEQKFRLNAIEREFKYREDRESMDAEQAMAKAKNDIIADVRADQLVSIMGAFSNDYGKGKLDKATLVDFEKKINGQMSILQEAAKAGYISNEQTGEITYQIIRAAQKGQMISLDSFSGMKEYTADYGKLVDETNANNAVMISAFEKFSKTMSGEDKAKLKHDYPHVFEAMERQSSISNFEGEDYIDKKLLNSWLVKLKKETTKITDKRGGVGGYGTGKSGTPGSKTVSINKNGNKTEVKADPDKKLTLQKGPELSDSQAQTKLQVKMVELLGASATILQYILVKESPDILLDKMTLSRKLLNTAQTQFAIGGLPKY